MKTSSVSINDKDTSNWITAVAGVVSGAASTGYISGACFGDTACQQNRDAQRSNHEVIDEELSIAIDKENSSTKRILLIGTLCLGLLVLSLFLFKKYNRKYVK